MTEPATPRTPGDTPAPDEGPGRHRGPLVVGAITLLLLLFASLCLAFFLVFYLGREEGAFKPGGPDVEGTPEPGVVEPAEREEGPVN